MTPLVLASTSPQRKNILSDFGVPLEIVAPDIDETNVSNSAFDEVRRLAVAKCRHVLKTNAHFESRWILAADTMIALGQSILGKPDGTADAERMIASLSGKTHQVVTGVAIYIPSEKRVMDAVDSTDVSFYSLDQKEIDWYVGTNEWDGAAGGYRVQCQGEYLVSSIVGSYGNVVGLPIRTICGMVAPYITDSSPLCNLPGLYPT